MFLCSYPTGPETFKFYWDQKQQLEGDEKGVVFKKMKTQEKEKKENENIYKYKISGQISNIIVKYFK